jgi:pseudaminic acid biosynthesis-associated methylase
MSTIDFWAGEFGREYNARQSVEYRDRIPLLLHILEQTGATTFLDVGTNEGHNLKALREINPQYEMSGIDVNPDALAKALAAGFDVQQGRADEAVAIFGERAAELVITSGVLIHVAPEELRASMAAIRDASSAYVLAIEYDSPEEREINYRGHAGKLWARPFGELYKALGLSLVEAGVANGYHDCQYWLLAKEGV